MIKYLPAAVVAGIIGLLSFSASATNWYVSSVAYTAVTQWAALTACTSGVTVVRQLAAPANGSERVFLASATGTTGAVEPTWVLTSGASTTGDGTCSWTEVTGVEADQHLNGVTNTWTAPAARFNDILATAQGGKNTYAPGDTIFVSSDHAETQASALQLTFGGAVAGAESYISSVNRTSSNLPPLSADLTAGASVTTTGSFSITFQISGGTMTANGLSFSAGTGSTTETTNFLIQGNPNASGIDIINISNGTIATPTTGASGSIVSCATAAADTGASRIIFNTMTFSFGNAAQNIAGTNSGTACSWVFSNVTVASSPAIPNVFFSIAGGTFATIDSSNFSALTTGHSIGGVGGGPSGGGSVVRISGSVIGSGATCIATGSFGPGSDISCVDIGVSGSTANTNNSWARQGGIITTSASTYRNSGNTSGGTPTSWLMTSNSQNKITAPFVSPPIEAWSAFSSGSHTINIDIVSSAALTNAQVWSSCNTFGTSGSPITTITSNKVINQLVTPVNQPTATGPDASWTSPPSTPAYQQLQISYTPTQAGRVSCKVAFAKASSTLYVDPLLLIQ
jgi:hypothetical protein